MMNSEAIEYELSQGEHQPTPEREERIARDIETEIDREVEEQRSSPGWLAKKEAIMRRVNASIRASGAESFEALRLAIMDYREGRITRREMEAAFALHHFPLHLGSGIHATPHGYIEIEEGA
jgi:hypothetical protein